MSGRLSRTEFDALKMRIALRTDDIVLRYCQGAELHNGKWNALNPRRSDRNNNSFVIYGRDHRKAGSFIDYAAGERGDALDLVAYLRGFGYRDREAALRETLDFLGELHQRPDPEKVRRELEAARIASLRHARKAKAEAEKTRRRTMALWRDCGPIIGTAAETYLREARGIDLDLLPALPGSLRYHPALANWKEPRHPATGKHPEFPALVGAMSRLGEPIVALQRTFLMPDGRAKAQVHKAKLIYPSSEGAVIRLSQGVNRCSPEQAARDGICGETLILIEGKEDGLTAALADHTSRIWACCGVTNIRHVDPGPTVSRVLVMADADWNNPAAQEALDDGLFALKNRGYEVDVAFPTDAKDLNSMLTGGRT